MSSSARWPMIYANSNWMPIEGEGIIITIIGNFQTFNIQLISMPWKLLHFEGWGFTERTRWWRLLLLSSSSFPVRLICLSVCLPLGRFCSSGSDSPLTSFFHLSPPSPMLPLNRRNRPWKCNFRTNLFPLWLEGRSITGTFVCLVQRKVLRWGSFGICSISPCRQINYKAMPRSKIEVSGWMDHLMVSSWRGTVKYSVLVDVDCDTPRAVL